MEVNDHIVTMEHDFWATKLPSGSPTAELVVSQTGGERWRWRGKRLDTPQVALLRSLLENDTPLLGSNLMYISPFDPGSTCTPGV
jgi:hypothetical protein